MNNGPNITVINVVISIVVPIVSVVAAHQFTATRDRRNGVRQAFVDLLRHLQQFRSAVVKINASKYWTWNSQTGERFFTGSVKPKSLGGDGGFLDDLTAAHVDLTADMLLMGMLLGHKGQKLTRMIKEIIDFQEEMNPQQDEGMRQHIERCDSTLSALSRNVLNEIAAVWNSIEQPFEGP